MAGQRSGQRGFIEALAKTGSVSRAAEAVNMSKEGAYALRLNPEAAEFIAAWEKAVDFGTTILEDATLERAIHGVPVPIFHKDKQVGERRTFNERGAQFQLQHRKPKKYGKPPMAARKASAPKSVRNGNRAPTIANALSS